MQITRLMLIHNISQALSGILNSQEICKEFCRLVQKDFGLEHVSIYRFDKGGQLELSACVDQRPLPQALEETLPEQASSLYRAINERKTISVEVPTEPKQHPVNLHQGARWQFCLPFSDSSGPLGIINVESEKLEPLAVSDIAALETLGDYLAIWVNNARLYHELQRKAHVLQTINNMGKAISAELNIHNLFELIHQLVSKLLPSEIFMIALYEKTSRRVEVKFEAVAGKQRRYHGVLAHDGLIAYCMKQKGPVLIADEFSRIYQECVGMAPFRVAQSWLGVPLIQGGEALGAIVLKNFRRRQLYDQEDVDFLATISDQAAVAIRNARLLQEEEERATRLAVVNEITRAASLTLNFDQLFETITRQLKRVVSFDKCSVALYQAESDTFLLLKVFGENMQVAASEGMAIPARETVMRIAYDSRQPYYTPSLDAGHLQTSPYLVTQGIHSAVSIPLVAEDFCLGTLNLGSQREHAFAPDQIEFLATIANSLGTALNNAHLYSKLEQSYTALKNTQEQLVRSEKLRAMGEMAVGVAHDFNNLLTSILGRAQLLKSQQLDPAVRRGLEVIEAAAIEGASTVKRLQDFTRQRADHVFEAVDLAQVVEETLSLTRSRWKDSAHLEGIRYDIAKDFGAASTVAGDSSDLREVFANILFNALEAMPHGGPVEIRLRQEAGNVVLSVADKGVGMDEEVRQRVFDPFFTTKVGEGKGLGMSVAYGIVSRHQGKIELTSAPGEGTTVKVILPVMKPLAREPIQPKVAQPVRRQPIRFLVIDDETPIREFLGEFLQESGHEVSTASTGKEGLEIFKRENPDMVITDLGMPEISGWEVAAMVKAHNPAVLVLLMTGWGISLEAEKAREKGVDLILSKPFQIGDMQNAINQLLEMGKARKASPSMPLYTS